MIDTILLDKLARLGYSKIWIDSGVLTTDLLEKQIKELELGEDDNTEHYRYRTFTNYFDAQNSFNHDVFKQVLQLLQSESDKTMAGSATIYLIRKTCLTKGQFDVVADFLQTFGDWTTKQVDRARQQITNR